MRRSTTARILLALFLVSVGVATGYTMADETVVVGEITAADHEAEEGYFALGQKATLIAQPGTKLHGWLANHRGQRVRVLIAIAENDSNSPTDPAAPQPRR
jgi:hypothetical protein